MTSVDCASGTDRIAEVASRHSEIDIFVNVQGDEPEMSGASIDRVIELLEENPDVSMATVATPIRSREQLSDPACVKVVFPIQRDAAGRISGKALYFSRSQIPFAREWDESLLQADPPHFYLHLGLYAYRRDFFAKLKQLPRLQPLEKLGKPRACVGGGIADSGRRGERILKRHRHTSRLRSVRAARSQQVAVSQ